MTALVAAIAAITWPKLAVLAAAVAATAGLVGTSFATSGWVGGAASALAVAAGVGGGIHHHRAHARRW